jgi:hypothetical protein
MALALGVPASVIDWADAPHITDAGICHRLFDLAQEGWSIALVTGAWGASARIKLATAGIPAGHIPLACSDDAQSRLELLRLAMARAGATSSQGFEHVVSVGDGLWDLQAAAPCWWSPSRPPCGRGCGCRWRPGDRVPLGGDTIDDESP